MIVEALKNAKVVKRIAKNPITNYFPKKKKIDKIISPDKILEPNHCDNINEPSHDEVYRQSEMNPGEIFDLQSKSQENDLPHAPEENTNTNKILTSEETSSKISYPKENSTFPDLNANLDANIRSHMRRSDDVMDIDSIKSDDPNGINPLDESIITTGPGINRTQNKPKAANRRLSDDGFLNSSTVDGFSPIRSFSDDKGNRTPISEEKENPDCRETFDLSFSSAPLFTTNSNMTSTSENSIRQNHFQDGANRIKTHMRSGLQQEIDNPFTQANIRMQNNLNRAIADSSSAYNVLQTILKSQTDPAFLSKTAKFPSNYNTPFSM